MMNQAKWIWIENGKPDVHAEFVCRFISRALSPELYLSCDGNYAVYLNGKFVGAGQVSDYETYKLVDRYDLNPFVREGENQLKICVWHIGVDSVNYRAEKAGVIFEIKEEGETTAYSSRKTLSRIAAGYRAEYCRMIAQVGITSLFDFTQKEERFTESVETDKKTVFTDDNVQNLRFLPFVNGKTVIREDKRVLVDLGEEYFGFVGFSVVSRQSGVPFTVSFGEHILPEGKLLRDIATCHFGLDFVAKEGDNSFCDYLRPVGCRYLEIVSEKEITVGRLGIVPFEYPFEEKPFVLGNNLDQKIYEVCIRTLRRCASKHYIDCPWREQGMYVLDSRNQMLCGYDAFGEFALARFNLVFLSKGILDCGLLSSCPPARQENSIIPFFSLIYFLQTYEYVERSGDDSVLDEVMPALGAVFDAFLAKRKDNGLIARFPEPKFWNFYEWTEGSNGISDGSEEEGETFDLILNATFLLAAEKYRLLLKRRGEELSFPFDDFSAALRKAFYDESEGLFRLSDRSHSYSRLGCSMALLAGVVKGEEAKRVASRMLEKEGIVDCSLSCAAFFYDALLAADPGYRSFVLDDIRRKYGYMLDCGATTFWETLRGSAENGGVGSLCHGWSAIPVYYYHKFFS